MITCSSYRPSWLSRASASSNMAECGWLLSVLTMNSIILTRSFWYRLNSILWAALFGWTVTPPSIFLTWLRVRVSPLSPSFYWATIIFSYSVFSRSLVMGLLLSLRLIKDSALVYPWVRVWRVSITYLLMIIFIIDYLINFRRTVFWLSVAWELFHSP